MADSTTTLVDDPEVVPTSELPAADDGIIRVEGARRTQKPANVELVGERYRALPMKALVALEIQKKFGDADGDPEKTIAVLERWLMSVFGRTQTPAIMNRLKDPADDLDLPDVMDLLQQLMARTTGNPTS